MIVKETGLPSEPPLPLLTGQTIPVVTKRRDNSAVLLLNMILLVAGSILLLSTVNVFFAQMKLWGYLTTGTNTVAVVLLTALSMFSIGLLSYSIRGLVQWFKQRKENTP